MHSSKQSVIESKNSPNTAGHLVQVPNAAVKSSSSIRALQQSIGNQALQRMVARSNPNQAMPRDRKEENGVIQGVFLDKHKDELPDHLWYKIFVNSGKSIRAEYLTRIMDLCKIDGIHKNSLNQKLLDMFTEEDEVYRHSKGVFYANQMEDDKEDDAVDAMKDEDEEVSDDEEMNVAKEEDVDDDDDEEARLLTDEEIMQWIEESIKTELETTYTAILNTDPSRQEKIPKKQWGKKVEVSKLGNRIKARRMSFSEILPRYLSHSNTAEKPVLSALDGNATWAWGAYKVGENFHAMGGNSSNDMEKDAEHNYHAEELIVTVFAEEIEKNNHGLKTSITKNGETVILVLGISKTPCMDICQGKINDLLEKYPNLKIQFFFDKLYEGRDKNPEKENRAIRSFFEKWGENRIKWLPEYRTDIKTVKEMRKLGTDPYQGLSDEIFSELFERASEAKVKKMSRKDLNEMHIEELDQALRAYRGSFLV